MSDQLTYNSHEYFQIPATEISSQKPRPFPLYIYLKLNDHLLLIRKTNQEIEEADLQKFAKAFVFFWCPKEFLPAWEEYKSEKPAQPSFVDNPPSSSDPLEPKGAGRQEIRVPPAPDSSEPTLPSDMARSEEAAEAIDLLSNDSIPKEEKKKRLKKLTQQVLTNLFSDQASDTPGAIDQCQEFVQDITASLVIDEKLKSIYEQILLAASQLQGDHSVRVSTFAVLFAMGTGITDREELEALSLAGVFHDIGIVKTNPDIAKAAVRSRTPEEGQEYKKHVHQSLSMIDQNEIPMTDRAKKLIEQHHERFDGNGYPARLQGSSIERSAQILSISDVFDYMVTGKWDSSARNPSQAFDELFDYQKKSKDETPFNPELFNEVSNLIQSCRRVEAPKPSQAALA